MKIIQKGFFLENQKTMLYKDGKSQQQVLVGVQPILIRRNSRQGLTMDCYSSKGGEMKQGEPENGCQLCDITHMIFEP